MPRPSAEVQEIVRASGNVAPAAISMLNEVNRTQAPSPASNRASSGGTPCASWVVMTTSPATATCGLQISPPMYSAAAQASSRRPSSQSRPQAVPVPFIRP
jgi:hypothetical protein